MTDLAVVGPDPRFGGGGAALVEAFLAGARGLGRSPELLFGPHPTLGGRKLTVDRVEALRQVRWGRRLAPRLQDATSVWVASPLAAHGLAARARVAATAAGSARRSTTSGRPGPARSILGAGSRSG